MLIKYVKRFGYEPKRYLVYQLHYHNWFSELFSCLERRKQDNIFEIFLLRRKLALIRWTMKTKNRCCWISTEAKKVNYLLYCSLLYFYFMRWNVFQGRGLTDILRQDESWLVKLFLRLVEINFFENFLSIILSLVFKPPLFYDRWL